LPRGCCLSSNATSSLDHRPVGWREVLAEGSVEVHSPCSTGLLIVAGRLQITVIDRSNRLVCPTRVLRGPSGVDHLVWYSADGLRQATCPCTHQTEQDRGGAAWWPRYLPVMETTCGRQIPLRSPGTCRSLGRQGSIEPHAELAPSDLTRSITKGPRDPNPPSPVTRGDMRVRETMSPMARTAGTNESATHASGPPRSIVDRCPPSEAILNSTWLERPAPPETASWRRGADLADPTVASCRVPLTEVSLSSHESGSSQRSHHAQGDAEQSHASTVPIPEIVQSGWLPPPMSKARS
jgi:hypothetical protein